MCSPDLCHACSKFGWTGCGQHVKDVMDALPEDLRCTCEHTVWPATA